MKIGNAVRLAIGLKLLNPHYPPIPPNFIRGASRFVRFVAACVNRTDDNGAILHACEQAGFGRNAVENFLYRCLDDDLARYPRLSAGIPLPAPAEDPLSAYKKQLSALRVAA